MVEDSVAQERRKQKAEWFMLVRPLLGRLKQDDCREFWASLGWRMRLPQKKGRKKINNTWVYTVSKNKGLALCLSIGCPSKGPGFDS